ncbi:MAG: DUF1330 domain-containing protein [Azonexus sp.]|nr:DUF1330 domain-containing protein [Azonexus sp.]
MSACVIRFPDQPAAENWRASPAYQQGQSIKFPVISKQC